MKKPKYGLNEISLPELIDIFLRHVVSLLIIIIAVLIIAFISTRPVASKKYYTSTITANKMQNSSNDEFNEMLNVLYSRIPLYMSDEEILNETIENIEILKYNQESNLRDKMVFDSLSLLQQAKRNIIYIDNQGTKTITISFSHDDSEFSVDFLTNLLITIENHIRETLSQQLITQYNITQANLSFYDSKLKSLQKEISSLQEIQDSYQQKLIDGVFREDNGGCTQSYPNSSTMQTVSTCSEEMPYLDNTLTLLVLGDSDYLLLQKEFNILANNIIMYTERLAVLESLFNVTEHPLLVMSSFTTSEQIVIANKSNKWLLYSVAIIGLGLISIVFLEINKGRIDSPYLVKRILGKEVNVISFSPSGDSRLKQIPKLSGISCDDKLIKNFGPILAFLHQSCHITDKKVINMINMTPQHPELPLSFGIAIAASYNNKRILVVNFDDRMIKNEEGKKLLKHWSDRISFELLDISQSSSSTKDLSTVTIVTPVTGVRGFREIVYDSDFAEYIKASEERFDLILITGPTSDDLSIHLPISSIADNSVVIINTRYPSRAQLNDLDMLFSLSNLYFHGVILEDVK